MLTNDDLTRQQARRVQRALKEEGLYHGRIDGLIGRKSRSALAKLGDDAVQRRLIEEAKARRTPSRRQQLADERTTSAGRTVTYPTGTTEPSPASTNHRTITPHIASDTPEWMKTVPAKTAVFSLATGKIILPDGRSFDCGSGKREHHNNPASETVKMQGPAPEGLYRASFVDMDHGFKTKQGISRRPAISLTPQRARKQEVMDTRTGIAMHQAFSSGNQSSGCVVVSNKETMRELYEARAKGLFDKVMVTRDAFSPDQVMFANNTPRGRQPGAIEPG